MNDLVSQFNGVIRTILEEEDNKVVVGGFKVWKSNGRGYVRNEATKDWKSFRTVTDAVLFAIKHSL